MFNNSLMDAIARRALERLDLEVPAAGGDAGKPGMCLACRTTWFVADHDASPAYGESVTELSVTGKYRKER